MGEWVEQFPLGLGGQLRVHQHTGAVRIRGVEGEQATVKATWPGTAEMADRLRLEYRPGVLEVEVQSEGRGWFGLHFDRNPVDLQIEVPISTACVIETGSGPTEVVGTGESVRLNAGSGPILLRQVGNVTVDGGSGQVLIEQIDGDLRLDVGSGPLVVRQVVGAVVIDAGSGNQLLEQIQGSARLDIGSGRVEIRGFMGTDLQVESGSGDLRLHDLDVQNLKVDSGSGRILVDLAQVASQGRYQIDAGSGGVTVNLPSVADLEIDLEYEGARLELGGLPIRTLDQERGRFRGQMGSGGARLKVETAGGLRLQAREAQAGHGEHVTVIAHEVPRGAGLAGLVQQKVALAQQKVEMVQQKVALAQEKAAMAQQKAIMAVQRVHGAPPEPEDEVAAPSEAPAGHSPTLREILDLVAQGKLSPAEADLLISRLEESAG